MANYTSHTKCRFLQTGCEKSNSHHGVALPRHYYDYDFTVLCELFKFGQTYPAIGRINEVHISGFHGAEDVGLFVKI